MSRERPPREHSDLHVVASDPQKFDILRHELHLVRLVVERRVLASERVFELADLVMAFAD